ncbi:MAG: tetratricopeptide repeat protein [Thermoanaerobaculia bacterium]
MLAIRYDRQGSERREAGDVPGAIQLFEKAIRHDRTWSVPWYNLGLTHKYAGQWEESYRCNVEAVRLDPHDEAALWNMGIAATAIGLWSEARRAWTLYGIELTPGEGPLDMDFGSIPIRINPNHDAEVVWARRIDPARAVLTSIPFPESTHRYGDLVLHDGAPTGYRRRGDHDVPVFDELALLASSHFGTYEVTITTRSLEELVAFESACTQAGCACEDWSAIRVLCRSCSEGTPHPHPEPPIEGDHRFAVAASSRDAVARVVRAWLSEDPRRTAGDVEQLLEPVLVQ